MEKKEKRAIFAAFVIASFGLYMLIGLIIHEAKNYVTYEYYDWNDGYGTSLECGEIVEGKLSCLVNGTYIPVKQYSKMDK